MDGNKDLSLEDVLSLNHLPGDLSIDISETPGILPANSEDTRGKSMEDMLSELPNDSPVVGTKHSRPSTVNSNCMTQSSGSTSEDMGHAIRRGMLDGMMFDSDTDHTDHDMDCDTDHASTDQSDGNIRRRRLDDVMDGKSVASTESSYHFDNVPADIQSCNMSAQNEDDSNSEVATACSDEDINHLEELYSDIFGDEEGEKHDGMIPRASSESSDLSSETLSMLGLLKDDRSTQSSVVSFDSTEFLEDEQMDAPGDPTQSKTSCSISMHDITTIHEEEEDDIAQEDEIGQFDHACFPTPLINGELHLRRQDLVSQGTNHSQGTFSSVTDDSYVGCMSFDSLSQGSSPRTLRKKWKMDMGDVHQDFTVLEPPPTAGFCMATPFNDESSQFTFESSRASMAEFSYDSFSSESVKYMVDILKEEAERRRSKIKERIAKIRESTEKVTYTSRYVESRLNRTEGDETSAGSSSLSL